MDTNVGHYEIKVLSPTITAPDDIVKIWYRATVPVGSSHIYDDPQTPFAFSFEYIPPVLKDEEEEE
jgi:hypothetical protein